MSEPNERAGALPRVGPYTLLRRIGVGGMATVYLARGALGTSERAGDAIDDALRRAGIRSRGIKKAGFRVLVGHSRPSALVECGFLTHPDEGRLLADARYQRRVAEAIASGVESALR